MDKKIKMAASFWVILLFISMNGFGSAELKTITLENNDVKAVFDKETGALVELSGKSNDWQFQQRHELGLSFQLLVPAPDKRNNPVFGVKQKLKKYEISADKKTITFYWEKLQSERAGVLDINITGVASLDSMGIAFNMKIENHSPYTVEAAAYPAIGDLSLPNMEEKLECMSIGYSGMDKLPIAPIFYNKKGYYGVDNPTIALNTNEQFILLGTPSRGFYIGCHDISLKEMLTYNFELKPGYGLSHDDWAGEYPSKVETGEVTPHLEFRVWHFPYINPNETASLSPIVMKPYSGSWHAGVDIYKNWRKTWFHSPQTPQWAKEVHSWQQIHINSPEDELRCQYKDLVKYGEDCAKYGVKAIQLTGWSNGGQDKGNPSHDTDPRLGSWQDLKDAIAKIEAMGVRVILFNKYTWADRSTEWFRNELIKYAVKDPYGDYPVYHGYQYQTPTQLADINTIRFVPMCQLSQQWRDIANKEFMKSIDLGASGMLYDENQHHGGATYCWDKSHGHHVPAYVFEGDMPLVNGFREITNKLKPDYLLAGEASYEVEKTQYSVSYFRMNPFTHIPLKRYIDPYDLIMVQVIGFNDRAMINACLKYRYIMSYEPYNFKGRLSDFPLTINYGQKIDSLRTKYKDYLWDGEYRDILGATVTSNGNPFDSYAVYRHATENKNAVVITNNNKEEIEVEVKIDNSNHPLVYVSPENMGEKKFEGKLKIKPLSVIVVMEK
ncbi:MAG: DUF6259 domain-containing protein [Prolixibacteraceae bacterium]